MPAQYRLLGIAVTLAGVGAGVLSGLVAPLVGLSFLSGAALGAASFGAVISRVRSGTMASRWGRLAAAILRWTYYLLLVGALYVLLTVWRAAVVWVLVGYTYALIVFAVYMARSGPRPRTRQSGP